MKCYKVAVLQLQAHSCWSWLCGRVKSSGDPPHRARLKVGVRGVNVDINCCKDKSSRLFSLFQVFGEATAYELNVSSQLEISDLQSDTELKVKAALGILDTFKQSRLQECPKLATLSAKSPYMLETTFFCGPVFNDTKLYTST